MFQSVVNGHREINSRNSSEFLLKKHIIRENNTKTSRIHDLKTSLGHIPPNESYKARS